MGNSFFYYIERLELISFFAGYPLIYALVHFLASIKKSEQPPVNNKLVSLLPYAYALTGSLFISFVIDNMNADYSKENVIAQFSSFIKIWGFFSLLFWIPLFSKKTYYSLLHSLVFFFLVIKDLFIPDSNNTIHKAISNDMKVYSISLLLNLGALFVIGLLTRGIKKLRKPNRSSANKSS